MNPIVRTSVVVAAAAVAFVPAGSALAAGAHGHEGHGVRKPVVRHFSAEGRVTATSGTASATESEVLTIVRREGRKTVTWTVSVNAKTLVRKADHAVSAADVKVGDRVAVKGDVVEKALVATRVNVARGRTEHAPLPPTTTGTGTPTGTTPTSPAPATDVPPAPATDVPPATAPAA